MLAANLKTKSQHLRTNLNEWFWFYSIFVVFSACAVRMLEQKLDYCTLRLMA